MSALRPTARRSSSTTTPSTASQPGPAPSVPRSLAELKATLLRDTDDRIPSLGELLATVAGAVPLFIELKSDGDGDRRIAPRIAGVLAGYAGRVAVMSFDPETMRAMRSLAPALPRGMVADRFDDEESRSLSWRRRFALRNLLHAPTVRPDFIAYGVAALPANAPLLLRHLGLPLLTWTVRHPGRPRGRPSLCRPDHLRRVRSGRSPSHRRRRRSSEHSGESGYRTSGRVFCRIVALAAGRPR